MITDISVVCDHVCLIDFSLEARHAVEVCCELSLYSRPPKPCSSSSSLILEQWHFKMDLALRVLRAECF